MGLLANLFRWLSGGTAAAASSAPAAAGAPLDRLGTAKDRIVAAIAARDDLDAAAKANATANIKGLYYMMLAAHDLARQDDREAAAQISMLLDRAGSGTASFTRDLRGLGEEGDALAHGLEAAFAACRDTIATRLPPR